MPEVMKDFVPPVAGKKVECGSCGLAELCIPHGLSGDEMANLDSITKTKKRMERNEILYHAGEEAIKIYAISSGSLKTSIISGEGSEQITGFYLPGEIVGLDGLGGIAPSSTAVAMESSTVCEIPEPEFDRLCQTNNGLRHSFMQIISKEISREQQQMMTLGQMSADARLAAFIIGLSHRFSERGFSSTEFNLSMSRHDIANYLGLAVETLSRLFKKFQNEGYLAVERRNVRILNRDGLCKASNAACAREKLHG